MLNEDAGEHVTLAVNQSIEGQTRERGEKNPMICVFLSHLKLLQPSEQCKLQLPGWLLVLYMTYRDLHERFDMK